MEGDSPRPKDMHGGKVAFAIAAIALMFGSSTFGGALPFHPFSSSGDPYVADTLVLLNNTLIPGSFLAANGGRPTGIAYDGKAGIFVPSGAKSLSRISGQAQSASFPTRRTS